MKKLSPVDTPTLKNLIRVGRLTLLLSTAIILMLSVLLVSVGAQDEPESEANNAERRDNLVYVSDDYDLMLYDPRNRTETMLLSQVSSFVMGRDGRIAFTRRRHENTHDLYVYDPSTPLLDPVNITGSHTVRHYAIAWSPDGKYLAFASVEDTDDHTIYVWDGEKAINIMPEDKLDTAKRFYVHWSYDGRLAFTIQYGWSNLDIPSELYVWDGGITVNLSQNPERWDGSGRWNQTGQLLFGSEREDEEYGVYVWDGISFKAGSPDTDAFIQLPVNLQFTGATWTDDGLVAYTLYSEASPEWTKEVVLWDLKGEAIVKRFSVSSENAWSSLAGGGQMIISSHLASGIPSVYLDVENTKGEILFSDHVGEFSWSSDGYLAYCGIEESKSRVLSIWDGQESWVVARVSYRPVQWQYTQGVFSCNNG